MVTQKASLKKYFNSREAADILGVNVSTIKRWTDRGALECLQSRGGHRKFSLQHLVNYIEKNPQPGNESLQAFLQVVRREDGDIVTELAALPAGRRLDTVYDLLMDSREEEIFNLFVYLYMRDRDLPRLFSENFLPFMRKLGEDWHDGSISVAAEHIASALLRRVLLRMGEHAVRRTALSESACSVLSMSLDGDSHDMGLYLLDLLLKRHGVRNYFSGGSTPTLGLKEFARSRNIRRFYISMVYSSDTEQRDRNMEELLQIASDLHIDVRLGGQGCGDWLDRKHPQLRILDTFYAIEEDLLIFLGSEGRCPQT